MRLKIKNKAVYYFHLAVLASDFRRYCADIIETAVCCTTDERPFRNNDLHSRKARVCVRTDGFSLRKKLYEKTMGENQKNRKNI